MPSARRSAAPTPPDAASASDTTRLELVPLPCVIVNDAGLIVAGNRKWFDLLRPPPGGAASGEVAERAEVAYQAALGPLLGELFATGAVHQHQVEIQRPDGAALSLLVEGELLAGSERGGVRATLVFCDVTARVGSERALAESERWFRLLAEHVPEAIFVHDLEGRILEANPQACHILGYSREELLTRRIADIETDYDEQAMREMWREVFESGSRTLSGTHRRKDGTHLPVEIRLTAFRVENRDAILAVTRDVSDRKRAEDSLVATSDVLQALIQASPLAVLALDRQARVTLWNPAAERIFGWSESEVLGHPVPFVQPGKEAEFQGLIDRVVAGEHLTGIALQRVRKDGRPIEISLSAAPLRDAGNAVTGTMALIDDITERRKAEAALRESEARYRTLFDDSPIALWEEDFSEVRTYLDRLRLSGIRDVRSYLERHPEVVTHALTLVKVLDLNRRALEFYPARDKESLLGSLDRILGPASLDMFREQLVTLAEGERTMEREFLSTGPDGAVRLLHLHLTVAAGSRASLQRVLVSYVDTTERHRAETAIREQTALSEALRDAAAVLTSTLNRDEVLERVLAEIGRVVPHDAADIMLIEGGQAQVVRMRGFRESVLADLSGTRRLKISEAPHLRYQVQTGLPVSIPDVHAYPGWPQSPETDWVRAYAGAPIRVKGEVIGFINVASANPNAFTQTHADRLQVFASQTAVALENARLFGESRKRAEELAALAEVSSALRTAPARAEMVPIILDKLTSLLQARGVALAMRDRNSGETVIELARGLWTPISSTRLRPGEGLIGRVIQMGQPMITDDMGTMAGYSWPPGLGAMPKALAVIPLVAQGSTIGALWAGNDDGFSESQVRILLAVGDIAANAIHRATLHEQTEQRLQRLMALHSIEMAISASTDLRVSLEILLNQVTTIMGVSAADVLLLDSHSQSLHYAAGNGFRGGNMAKTRVRLGEGLAGRAVLDRALVHVADLGAKSSPSDGPRRFTRAALIVGEGFQTYFAVPLVSKGQALGVLEIFHRAALDPDPEWMEFLQTLAGQAALALDNAALFEKLQRTNVDLVLAYDATLEGWSKALDLRDRETEGHTQRVTELAMRLSRAMGVSESQLEQIRRGALIHDIGKMGIPDSILLKPGPLTEDEWGIMRRHPTLAYDFLSSIAFLRQALDIPYAHHEHWDGSGYPRMLKGDQIPLAARIFAVIDVYDALCSDRPYRPAWPETKAREYIREQSAKYFDPKVVDAFLGLKF